MLSGIYSVITAQECICHHGFLLLGDTRLYSRMTGEWIKILGGMAVLIQKQSNGSFQRKIGVRVALIPGKLALFGSPEKGDSLFFDPSLPRGQMQKSAESSLVPKAPGRPSAQEKAALYTARLPSSKLTLKEGAGKALLLVWRKRDHFADLQCFKTLFRLHFKPC